MSRETTVNNITFKEAAKKNWFLSLKSPSPKQTLTVYFADGKEYKYLGTGRVSKGDPVLIDFGGASSYMMGNVVATENGITIKRTHALKPLFAFSTDPGKSELKENSKGVKGLVEIGDVAGCFSSNPYACTENEFRVVDFLVSSALNAITVIAYPELSTPDSIKEAREFLAKEKPVPGLVFSKPFTDAYYGYRAPGLRSADSSEVAFTGFYPGWDEELLGCAFWNSDEYKDLKIETEWDDRKMVYYLYFLNGSKKREKYFSTCEEFKTFTNELVFRSALSVLIRGGCVNLLKAALSVEMPIKGFYKKLIAFADEIGSTECSSLLKSVDYENKVFEKAPAAAPGGKKTAAGKKAPAAAAITADKSFKIKDAVLLEYKGDKEVVEIPDGVKVIDEFAFYENKTIKKVVFPDSVTQIKKCAFANCENLQEIVFGKGVSSLGTACFANCKALAFVNFAVTKIKTLTKEAFSGCEGLTELDLSSTKITAIKDFAFKDSGLKKILLPAKLEAIENSAFNGTKISEIVIPETVKEINMHAFLGMFSNKSDLKRIVFKGSAPINFRVISVANDCVIVCKGGSALLEQLERENEKLEADYAKYPNRRDRARKLEEY